MVPPFLQHSGKAAQQEVAAAAGRVDHPQLLMPEFPDRRLEGAGEDPFLHEVRRLQQGEALAGVLRQILVEVAEEAGVPVGVGEVVRRRPGLGPALAEEVEQLLRAVA